MSQRQEFLASCKAVIVSSQKSALRDAGQNDVERAFQYWKTTNIND
jgi:hypothetical protein